jgi:hypothetical protein
VTFPPHPPPPHPPLKYPWHNLEASQVKDWLDV